jgi:cytochrome c-type biogenesis protein CcmF
VVLQRRNGEFTTEVAINRGLSEDLYLTLGGVDFSDGSGTFKVVINPLVDWVWLGFMLLAIGTAIALMPELALAPVAARVTAAGGAAAKGAGTAVLLLVLGLGLLGANRALAATDAEAVRKEMSWFGSNLRCMCSMGNRGCGHMLEDCGAECGGAPVFRREIQAMLEQGKTRGEIVAMFAERFGGMHVLGAPPDTGFNRLAWALPYGWGWPAPAPSPTPPGGSRSATRGGGGPTAAEDKAYTKDRDLEDKLEDELSRVDT